MSHDLAALVLDGIMQVASAPSGSRGEGPPALPMLSLEPDYKVFVFPYQMLEDTESALVGVAVTTSGTYVVLLPAHQPAGSGSGPTVHEIGFHLAPSSPSGEGEASEPRDGFFRVLMDPFTKVLTCTLFPANALEKLVAVLDSPDKPGLESESESENKLGNE